MPLIRKPPAGPQAVHEPVPERGAVLDALARGTDDERWAAARSAVAAGVGAAALGDALAREQTPVVREALFSALSHLASPQAVETLLPLLRSDDALIRTEAADALQAMKQVAWPYAAALLRDDDPDVRILACGLVRDMPGPTAVALYCDLLDSEPQPNVCAAAVEALAEIGGAAAVPVLTRCAERFRGTPFLEFSIKVAIDRVRSQP